jgi:hypothetical protein
MQYNKTYLNGANMGNTYKDAFTEAYEIIMDELATPKVQKLSSLLWIILLLPLNFLGWYKVIRWGYVDRGILMALVSIYSGNEIRKAFKQFKLANSIMSIMKRG